MTVGWAVSRARPASAWLALILSLGVLAPLAAQVRPVPGDSVRPDTVLVPIPPDLVDADTVPTALAEAAASRAPLRVLPLFPDSLPLGFAHARWEFDNQQLASIAGLTLLEFLERIPGVVGFRAGGFGRPEGLTAFGFGGGRLRVYVDGIEIDPIGAGAYELETIPLLDINRITVDRTLSEIRVEIRTFRLEQPDPHSVVELGTGVYQTRLLRALFSRGFGDRAVGTGGFDLLTTNGIGIREAYSHSSAVFRYAYALNPSAGLQADWRRTAIDRRGTLYPRQTTRTDVSARGRAEVRDDLVVEAMVGRVTYEEAEETIDAFRASRTQVGVRAGFASGWLDADGALRARIGGEAFPPMPDVETEARVAFEAIPRVRIEADGQLASADSEVASNFGATAVLSFLSPVSLFGSARIGTRLVPVVQAPIAVGDPVTGRNLVADAIGWRAGAEVGRPAFALGAAAFVTNSSPVTPFGLPFDTFLEPMETGALPGIEATLFVLVPGTAGSLSLDGWYSRLGADALLRPYAPQEMARAGFFFRDVFYGGQLEPALRVELIHHGRALVPRVGSTDPPLIAPAHQTANLALRIRIIDVEAFLIWDNLFANRAAVDLPGSPPAFQRIVYGAEWRFRG